MQEDIKNAPKIKVIKKSDFSLFIQDNITKDLERGKGLTSKKTPSPFWRRRIGMIFYSIKLVCFVFHFVNFIGIQKVNIPKVITVNTSQSIQFPNN